MFDVLLLLLSLASFFVSVAYFGLNAYLGRKRRVEHLQKPIARDRVTIVVPVHREDLSIFRPCLESVRAQRCPFVVVGDETDEPYRSLVLEAGGTFLTLAEHVGKKRALAASLEHVRTEFVLFLDSDTVLGESTLDLLSSRMVPGVGGVAAHLRIRGKGSIATYSAEFVERSREVVHGAMSRSGRVIVLDGACALYRTALVRPFMASPEFLETKVLGRTTSLGDDWLLTAAVADQGFQVVKAPEAWVETQGPGSMREFFSRNLRWSRSGWIRFGREVRTGTLLRSGHLYAFEVLALYSLPLLTVGASLSHYWLLLVHTEGSPSFADVLATIIGVPRPSSLLTFRLPALVNTLRFVGELGAVGAFVTVALRRVQKDRLRLLVGGVVGSMVLLSTAVLGLFTFWKAPSWEPRAGSGLAWSPPKGETFAPAPSLSARASTPIPAPEP